MEQNLLALCACLGASIKLDIPVLAGSMTAKLICDDALTKIDFSSKVTIFTA